MSKHTPGPWSLVTISTSIGHAHKVESVGACLYVDYQHLPHDAANPVSQEALANARLIAAAPDLYERLQQSNALIAELRAYLWFSGDRSKDDALIAAEDANRAALAKAGGA